MSFVVRHKATGYYLQSHHAWTNHLDGALRFNSGLRLVHYVERAHLHENPELLEILPFPGDSPSTHVTAPPRL